MTQTRWEVVLFETENQEIVSKFIKDLAPKDQAKLYRLLEKLSLYGPKLRQPFSQKLDKDLYELRTLGKVNVRLLYVFHKQQIVILHGFIKKTQKTPKKELKTALDRYRSIA